MAKICSAQFGSPEGGISPIKEEEDTLPNNFVVGSGEAPFRTLQYSINVDLPYDGKMKKLRPFIPPYENVESYVKVK